MKKNTHFFEHYRFVIMSSLRDFENIILYFLYKFHPFGIMLSRMFIIGQGAI